jgi:hypothetical protein
MPLSPDLNPPTHDTQTGIHSHRTPSHLVPGIRTFSAITTNTLLHAGINATNRSSQCPTRTSQPP